MGDMMMILMMILMMKRCCDKHGGVVYSHQYAILVGNHRPPTHDQHMHSASCWNLMLRLPTSWHAAQDAPTFLLAPLLLAIGRGAGLDT
jgi:hypothetical protein